MPKVPVLVAALLSILALQTWAGSVAAQNHGGFVTGHPEGAPPISGTLCVTYGPGGGGSTFCKSFTTGGPNDIALSIPPQGVAGATFTVTVDGWSTVDDLAGQPCTNKPVTAPAGMALCQTTDPAYASQVHRFNAVWNTNAQGNGTQGGRPGLPAGTGTGR